MSRPESPRPVFPDSPEAAILCFARDLRQAGAGTTTTQTLTAFQALSLMGLADKTDFKNLLKACLISSREGLVLFDACFEQFFKYGLPPDRTAIPEIHGPPEPSLESGFRVFRKEEEEEAGPDQAGTASLLEVTVKKNFRILDPGEAVEVRRQVLLLARLAAERLQKRAARSGRARRIDFRRTFRASLQSGGELIRLKHRSSRHRPRRLVLFGDVSGSMELYTRFFLLFMSGLSEALPGTETFVFSTRLVRLTRLMKKTNPGEVLDRLARSDAPFSGGTDIGGCLESFFRRHRSALVGRRITFIILSDGWDRGDPAVLDSALKKLKKTGQHLIWLNPLAAEPGFAPLASGMAAAFPYLSALLPFGSLEDVEKLAHVLGGDPLKMVSPQTSLLNFLLFVGFSSGSGDCFFLNLVFI